MFPLGGPTQATAFALELLVRKTGAFLQALSLPTIFKEFLKPFGFAPFCELLCFLLNFISLLVT